jgi:membrane-associated phospholipid phosphatase
MDQNLSNPVTRTPPPLLQRLLAFIRRHPWSLSLGSLSTLFFLKLAHEMREGELDALDSSAAELAAELHGPLDGLMVALTMLGNWQVMTSLAVLCVVVLFLRAERKAALFVGFCSLGGPFLNSALKVLFQRARPDAYEYLIALPSSFSFPSGHAMGSMCVLGGMVVLIDALGLKGHHRWLFNTLAAALILGIGFSRVYLGVHYFSDVLGGQLAGAAWVAAVTGWFYPRLLPGERTVVPPPQTE